MKTDTTLSRRRLLAGVPAVAAAAAVPSIATALGRLPTDDPVIEVVARHRRAWEAYEAAWLHMSETEDEHGSEEQANILLYEYDKRDLVNIKHNDDEWHVKWVKTGKKTPVFKAYPADSGSPICSGGVDPARLALLRGLSRLMMSQ